MKHIHLSVLTILAACSSPAVCGGCGADGGLPDGELPSAFRIEAEVVSVEPSEGIVERACDPYERDPAGPDWIIDFDVADPAAPKFDAAAAGGDESLCVTPDRTDCCEAVEGTATGWRITCHGYRTPAGVTRAFAFDIDESGAGAVTSTTMGVGGSCVSRASWSALVVAP